MGAGKFYLERTAALKFNLLKKFTPSALYYFVNGFNTGKVNPTKQHEKTSGFSYTKNIKFV